MVPGRDPPQSLTVSRLYKAGFAYAVGCRRGGCAVCKVDCRSGQFDYDHPRLACMRSVLEEGGASLVDFGFKVWHEYDIEDIEKEAETFGCIVERMSRGDNPEVSDGIRIHTVLAGAVTTSPAGPAGARTGRQAAQPVAGPMAGGQAFWKVHVVEVAKDWPASRTVEGKPGWLGESGKCWVSSASPSPCR